jgi:protein-disulfide isomerase
MLLADDHVRGAEDAPLLLVMYGDFECPYCQAAQGIVARVRARLGDELRFAFRHFPIRAQHPRAEASAQASESAAAQGAFWPMHDALYARRGALEDRDLLAAARDAGVGSEQVAADLRSGVHAPRVQRDLDAGVALGLHGTPGFVANGRLVPGAFDARSLVDALRGG